MTPELYSKIHDVISKRIDWAGGMNYHPQQVSSVEEDILYEIEPLIDAEITRLSGYACSCREVHDPLNQQCGANK